MNSRLIIQLPVALSREQERLILKYQAQGRQSISYAEWPLVLSGFNILHTALVMTHAGTSTFRKIYNTYIESSFTELYITELLKLSDVSREYFSLHARLSREMVTHLRQVGLVRSALPQTNLLLAYCSYFFRSFAAGYAFEVQIYRDLNQSGIIFEAHDIRDRQARRSFHDLKVSDWHGDIKTSLYFLRVGRSRRLPHDFYVTRLYVKGRPRILVVMLKPEAWNKIDGETVTRLLDEAVGAFPQPVSVKLKAGTVVIADYEVWKTKIFLHQHKAGE